MNTEGPDADLRSGLAGQVLTSAMDCSSWGAA